MAVPAFVQADITYDTDTTISATPAWGENVNINPDVTVTMNNNILIGQTTNITVNIDGALSFTGDKTGNHDANNSLVTANDKSITFSGTGTLIKKGTGGLATATGNQVGTNDKSVIFAMGSNGLIDIQAGILRNGGYGYQDWSTNKGDMNIASGATLDPWDGAAITIDALTGGGSIKNTAQNYGKDFTIGVDGSQLASGAAPVFS